MPLITINRGGSGDTDIPMQFPKDITLAHGSDGLLAGIVLNGKLYGSNGSLTNGLTLQGDDYLQYFDGFDNGTRVGQFCVQRASDETVIRAGAPNYGAYFSCFGRITRIGGQQGGGRHKPPKH